MMERGQLDFVPQPLVMVTWRPDDPAMPVKGVIAALHGFAVHAERGFHYFGPYMAARGWIVVAIDMPGFGHWQPASKRGTRAHWRLLPTAIDALVKRCHDMTPGKPVVLMGSSIGALGAIDYMTSKHECPVDGVAAVVALVPAVGEFVLPWYLYLPGVIFAHTSPYIRLSIAKFVRLDSHDPNSIVYTPDPLVLDKVTLGFLWEILKTMKRAGIKGNAQARWSPKIPIYLVSAGLDKFVKSEHIRTFYDGLPEGTMRQLDHRPGTITIYCTRPIAMPSLQGSMISFPR
ncbi:MAG: alpha/beta hydrolase [Candidatus Lokiarchaeota archaeon]|nr:alpha/beta hydrolase [Candidatus Lokiarchaeota archaeon]